MTARCGVKRSPLLSAIAVLGLAATIWLPLATLARAMPTPPDQGAPSGRQRGGASRGDCADYQGLTALVPVVDGIVWSQTHSPNPKFFFHVPKALTADIPLELVVQDSNDNYLFHRQFSVDAPSGILTIPLTSEGAGLMPGETYSWTFSIYCDLARPSAAVSVFGTIRRVADAAVPLSDTSPSTQPLKLAQQYAAAGLWHEAMGLTLSVAEPNNADYLATLTSLLELAGLADLSPAALVYEVPE
ncbi:DUF928 domain-containing protein [Nodosilinea sp. FACHB-13]|uniref:DUF928 domain-containing protein n=1 Tax=Cyanophyceae TaxID=3028117 RepID=UPI0016827090|nr:DUF928 domain-containing protein [Nodosilinea sp. FACHB-13]MBD2110037.1 DUF928 domain-containing protein [Nodosilinea sp. FACHB-13]